MAGSVAPPALAKDGLAAKACLAVAPSGAVGAPLGGMAKAAGPPKQKAVLPARKAAAAPHRDPALGVKMINLSGPIAKVDLATKDSHLSAMFEAAVSPPDQQAMAGLASASSGAVATPPDRTPTAGLATAHSGAAAGSASQVVALPGGAVLAAVDPAAEQILAATAFVECSLCKRLYPKGSCVDPDRNRVAGVNRKPRVKCKTCNSFAKSRSTTLAGHVGLRDQWEEKTPEQRAAWIDEQRLALQSFGQNAVLKELTQCLSITLEVAESTEEKEQFGVERDWLDAEGVKERFKHKPHAAKTVFASSPKYPKWHCVWMPCSCVGCLLLLMSGCMCVLLRVGV